MLSQVDTAFKASKWDWYTAVINRSPSDVYKSLSKTKKDFEVEEGPGIGHGYSVGHLMGWGGVADRLRMYTGEDRPTIVQASGPGCNEMVPVIRGFGPHGVSRADVAVDFRGDFAATVHALRGAACKKVRTEVAGDWLDAEHGRTLYLGARTSDVRVRLYEKGLERQEKGAEEAEAPSDWLRLEAQIRPGKKPQKVKLSNVQAADCWGIGALLPACVEALAGIVVEAVDWRVREVPDHERSMQALTSQYGGVLLTHLASMPGPSSEDQRRQWAEDILRRIVPF